MKYDKSVIMKSAWAIKYNFERKTGLKALYSECLKSAWRIAKNVNSNIEIKSWFLNKYFSSSEKYFILTSSKSIKRETDKAILVHCTSKIGIKNIWIPKSCLKKGSTL